ncbi:hypothetical protein QFZ66_000298 [Streptomyces sp. B4I13]|nr:hypothetical protein [Streptomyces sp. B4I13]
MSRSSTTAAGSVGTPATGTSPHSKRDPCSGRTSPRQRKHPLSSSRGELQAQPGRNVGPILLASRYGRLRRTGQGCRPHSVRATAPCRRLDAPRISGGRRDPGAGAGPPGTPSFLVLRPDLPPRTRRSGEITTRRRKPSCFPGVDRRPLPAARHRDGRALDWHAAPSGSNPPPIRMTAPTITGQSPQSSGTGSHNRNGGQLARCRALPTSPTRSQAEADAMATACSSRGTATQGSVVLAVDPKPPV